MDTFMNGFALTLGYIVIVACVLKVMAPPVIRWVGEGLVYFNDTMEKIVGWRRDEGEGVKK